MCHTLTHAEIDLSVQCGWMTETGIDPFTVPALVAAQVGVGWAGGGVWVWLDTLDPVTGRPTGMFAPADPAHLPPSMWPGTWDEAITLLHRTAA
jgi:hypothetical protein